jgi:probable HAF family extracellular repeat protein
MNAHHRRSLVLGLFVLLMLARQSEAAQSYTIQELGVGDALGAAGPNLSGQVVVRSGFGIARSSLITPNAVAGATSGEASNVTSNSLGFLPRGNHTTANAVNDSGTVVASSNGPTSVRPVLWTRTSALQDLGTLPGDNAGEAFGINNAGAVVGFSGGPQGIRAFLWTASAGMQRLNALPGGDFSKAFAISDRGLIVGSSGSSSGTRAVLWSLGGIQDLGTLPGGATSEAFAVNNQGSVVGYSRGLAGDRAFIWTAQSGLRALDPLGGGSFSRARAINDSGDVVGVSGSQQNARAVVWNAQGAVQDLNVLVSVPPGLVLREAVGINARGQILALAKDERDTHLFHEGFNRVFLLTPSGP